MNYQITLMSEHCVVSTTLYDSPAGMSEDDLVEAAVETIKNDFPVTPRTFHDFEITSWED